MKKLILFIFSALIAGSAYSQLVVEESGNVAAGYSGTNPLNSSFSINHYGSSAACAYINANKTSHSQGLYVYRNSSSTAATCYGAYVQNVPVTSRNNYGVYATSSTSGSIAGKSCGIFGKGGGTTSGYNFGVIGTLSGTNSGAGVFGSSSGDTWVSMSSKYAGYFMGNVNVTGGITAASINTTSDYRLKKDIKPLSSSALDEINKMNVVEFYYKQRQVDGDSCKVDLFDEKSDILTHKHYGLIAQELQEIYPELVSADGDGYLSVNYVEIIPLLISSIQELQARLQVAENGNAYRVGEATAIENQQAMQTVLYQNTPNPFSEQTVIACTVAENVKKAILYVYDMSGKQLSEYPIDARGKTSVTIEGGSLDAGMYLYSLIADGNVIDTKRMILTK